MRVMPFIHVMPAIVIPPGPAVALLQSDGSFLLGCQRVLIMVGACSIVPLEEGYEMMVTNDMMV